jgi:lysozyme
MNATEDCFQLIKTFEGCRLKAYRDPGSSNGLPITIGWGSTMRRDGTRFILGDTITQEQADELLYWEVISKARIVESLTYKCTVTQNQFNALVSFVYNVGVGNLANSTLLKKINLNDPTAADEFLRWNKVGSKVLKGLTLRREAERNLYLKH